MGAFLGPVGGLERVASPTSEPVEVPPRLVMREALSGRVTAQRLPRGRRVWACAEGSVRPEDAVLLEWLAAGGNYDQSNGYVWYSSYAVVTNILTPAESLLEGDTWSGGSQGGAGAAGGVRYLASLTGTVLSDIRLVRDVAVPSSRPVSVSVHVSTHPVSGASVYVDEYDPEGATVGDPHTVTVDTGQHAHRATINLTTSVRTVALRIRVVGALMVTMPAVTLTRATQPWAVGQGCAHAVVSVTGEDPQLAFETPTNWGRRAGRSFTIHELG